MRLTNCWLYSSTTLALLSIHHRLLHFLSLTIASYHTIMFEATCEAARGLAVREGEMRYARIFLEVEWEGEMPGGSAEQEETVDATNRERERDLGGRGNDGGMKRDWDTDGTIKPVPPTRQGIAMHLSAQTNPANRKPPPTVVEAVSQPERQFTGSFSAPMTASVPAKAIPTDNNASDPTFPGAYSLSATRRTQLQKGFVIPQEVAPVASSRQTRPPTTPLGGRAVSAGMTKGHTIGDRNKDRNGTDLLGSSDDQARGNRYVLELSL